MLDEIQGVHVLQQFQQATVNLPYYIVLYGSCEFMQQEIISQLKKRVYSTLSLDCLASKHKKADSEEETDNSTIFDELQNSCINLNGKTMLYAFQNAIKLTDSKSTKKDAKSKSKTKGAKILEFIKKIKKDRIYVLSFEKSQGRSAFFNYAKKKGILVNCEEPKQQQTKQLLIQYMAQKLNITIDAYGIQQLKDYSETNMMYAYNNLKILKDLGFSNINAETIINYVEPIFDYKVYSFNNACGSKNKKEAILILRKLGTNSSSLLGLITALANHFRKIWKIKHNKNIGGPYTTAKSMNMHPYAFSQILMQVSRFNCTELANNMLKLAKLNERIHLGASIRDVENFVLQL